MITDVYVVYNDENQVKRIGGAYTLKVSPIFHFMDSQANKTKKEAWALKSHWAAKEDPFAIVMDGEKAVKAFYSETGEDVIQSLINYLNSQENEGTSPG